MKHEHSADEAQAGVHLLDAKGLLCPLPVIRTQDRLRSVKPGERLKVLCTDPGTLHDIPSWCRVHGHKLLETLQDGDEIQLLIEKIG